MKITDIAIRCKTREEKIAAVALLSKISGLSAPKEVSNGDAVIPFQDVFILATKVDSSDNAETFFGKKMYTFNQIPQLLLDLYAKKRIITIDGKDIEISVESFQELKKQLCS